MTVRLRTSVIPGLLALTALSLTACASQGTIGAGSPDGGPLPGAGSSSPSGNTASATGGDTPSSAGTDSSAPSSADTASSPAASGSQDPSALASSLKTLNSLWTDQGCKIALAGFGDYVSAEQANVLQGVAAIPAAEAKIRTGAQQTRKPGAADAMNKLADDLQTIFDQAKQGKTPNNGPVRTDFQVMGNVCSTGNN